MNENTSLEPANPNPFAVAGRDQGGQVAQRGSMMDAEVARGVAEVQGAMVIAKRFPRSETESYSRIMQTCERVMLAEAGTYSYPKGDKTVTGPSIRLAEAIAQRWGNIRSGVDEVEQHEDYSIVRAWAWDLETNHMESKTFTVRHEIMLKGGRFKKLTDPREIYELCANVGARRKRACIIAIIPGDVVEAAVEKCEETLAKKDGAIPIADRIRKMASAFHDFGVNVAMIEKRFKHKIETISEQELIILRGIYTSIKDGEGKVDQYFESASEVKAPEGLEAPPATQNTPPVAPAPAAENKPADPVKRAKKTSAEKPAEPATTAPAPTTPVEPAAPAPPAAATEAPAPAAPATQPKAGSHLNQLKSVMALEGIGDGEVLEVAIRKYSCPMVNSLEELGETGCKVILEKWEEIAGQVRIDRKNNEQ